MAFSMNGAPLKVGQHVKLTDHPWHACHPRDVPIPASSPLQYGDRFTVMEIDEQAGMGDGPVLVLLSHKCGRSFRLAPQYLSHVTYGPEPAGAPRGSFTMLRALSDVLQHEMPSAMQDVILDLERARMTAEDFRQGNGPAVEIGCSRHKRWASHRQWADEAFVRLADAEEALSNIRAETRSGVVNINYITEEINDVLGSDNEEERGG